MERSIYWYDYETFGIDPKLDRIAQFAGIRTDEELNVISDPLMIYCKPASDMLPDPVSCLITGITPQIADAEGLIEAEFIKIIHSEISKPGTCLAGYNNIRFDDEFTRYTLYRNFYNPYAHEWQHGNSRWDIIDMVRLTRALRPEGINWPNDENGPSIRLEKLTDANHISHESAHDAMSDVYATIAVAKLIKQKQPKLYDYVYSHRQKSIISKQLNLRTHDMVLHASSKYPPEKGAIAVVMPVCAHPTNKNGIIVYDLSVDPSILLSISSDELTARLFTKNADLPEDTERVHLKTVHINKCPVIAPLNTLTEESTARLGLDLDLCRQHRQTILDQIELVTEKIRDVFIDQSFSSSPDPDTQLYSGGFFSPDDSNRMEQIRTMSPATLADTEFSFDDQRLPELLFRYRARNHPETLTPEESDTWEEFRNQRFNDPSIAPRTYNQLKAQIEEIRLKPDITGTELSILDDVIAHAAKLTS